MPAPPLSLLCARCDPPQVTKQKEEVATCSISGQSSVSYRSRPHQHISRGVVQNPLLSRKGTFCALNPHTTTLIPQLCASI